MTTATSSQVRTGALGSAPLRGAAEAAQRGWAFRSLSRLLPTSRVPHLRGLHT